MGNVDVPDNPILCCCWVLGVLLITPFGLAGMLCGAITMPVLSAGSTYRKDYAARHIHPLRIPGGGIRNRKRPTARDQPRCKFLHRLPIELRNRILADVLDRGRYEYTRIILDIEKPLSRKIMSSRRYIECTTLYEDHRWIKRRAAPAIMLTCRQLFYESLAILYGQNKFHFSPEFFFNTPAECWLAIERLNKFGDQSAVTLIQDLKIEMPLVECMFSCRRCRKSTNTMWQRLYDMKALRRLAISLRTTQGGSFPGWRRQCPALAKKEDLDSFKAKLMGLKQVEKVSLYVGDDRGLYSRLIGIGLDPGRFELTLLPTSDPGVTTYGRVFEF